MGVFPLFDWSAQSFRKQSSLFGFYYEKVENYMVIKGLYGEELTLFGEVNDKDEKKGTILIFPGGGYSWLSPREDEPVARCFEGFGFRAASLHYDCDTSPLLLRPLQQSAWAVSELRRLFPGEPVYLMGFSAGSHCACSLGVHWNHPDWKGRDWYADIENSGDEEGPVLVTDRKLLRPDGMVLAYPVITSGSYAHRRSIECLTGSEESWGKSMDHEEWEKLQDWFSLEKQIDDDTPPAFLWHTATDETVPVENSILFFSGLHAHGINCEMHIYPAGRHGLSLATEEVQELEAERFPDEHIGGWVKLAAEWMDSLAR